MSASGHSKRSGCCAQADVTISVIFGQQWVFTARMELRWTRLAFHYSGRTRNHRRCSATLRQPCLEWSRGPIGAFTEAAGLAHNLRLMYKVSPSPYEQTSDRSNRRASNHHSKQDCA